MTQARISLWRYRERTLEYPGFHLGADPQGASRLLALLANLATARKPQIATVTLDPVTPGVLAVQNVRNPRVIGFRHWDLAVDPRFAPEQLQFTVVGERVRTEMSLVQVESVAAGVEDIRVRRGYSIGDEEEHQLWFWWQEDLIAPE